VAFQRVATKYFLRVLMKGHMCIMNIGKVANKKNRWFICELEERLTKGDVGSSMDPIALI
jgi:hypothetical protein